MALICCHQGDAADRSSRSQTETDISLLSKLSLLSFDMLCVFPKYAS